MDVEAATVIEVFPAEESELASLDFAVGDGSFRSRGALAWASDGAGEHEVHEEQPATAEADFGGRPESLNAGQREIRPKSSWVGFIDFGDHAGDEGEDPGQPGLPRNELAGARGTKQRKGRKRNQRIKPESGGGGVGAGQRRRQLLPPTPGPGPPAAPGVPAISLTQPTPPASLSEGNDGYDSWGVRSKHDENGAPRKWGGKKRGSGVEALDKYHWDARKKRKRSSVVNGNGTGDEETINDGAKAAEGSRTTTHILERNGEVLALKISLSSKAISTTSLRSIDSAAHRSSGPCSCSPKHGGRLCKGTVLVSLGMAIAGALYFGSLSAGSSPNVAHIMDAFNCSSLTDCRGRWDKLEEREAVSAPASRWTNETEEVFSASDVCAMDHCFAPCSAAAAAVKRCDDGFCVMKRDCEDLYDDGAAAKETERATRLALIGILVFAICCLVGAGAVMTPCTKRLCAHCSLRNRRGEAR